MERNVLGAFLFLWKPRGKGRKSGRKGSNFFSLVHSFAFFCGDRCDIIPESWVTVPIVLLWKHSGVPPLLERNFTIMGFLTKLFGTNMAKEIKRLEPIVKKIEALEEEYKGLTDAQLQAKTAGIPGALSRMARPWTTCCPRPLPPAGRRPTGCWACGPTGCSSWAASSSTRAASPR